ncbi:hypothetical protein HF882_00220 [Victivallis vadensis]|jgi:hypothetical protein|uniref:Transcriptional activator TraM n=1 Tax=Victivallis vadensis TaxID=172901 RepID=A0A848ATR1_9BACT|nr:hypothetical protein [Victivallis vadensis]NMD85000.1 hypothetical protein [Victivallis vadensis]
MSEKVSLDREQEAIQEPSLRDAVLEMLSSDGTAAYPVIEKLAAFENSYPNDIVYALILENEITHRMLNQLAIRQQQQNQVIAGRLTERLDSWQEQLRRDMIRRDLIARSQFRRLVALHRERFLTRTILFTAVGISALLAGLGIYWLYRLIGG